MNFTDRCNIATACLPRDDYRAKLEALHAEMLAAIERNSHVTRQLELMIARLEGAAAIGGAA